MPKELIRTTLHTIACQGGQLTPGHQVSIHRAILDLSVALPLHGKINRNFRQRQHSQVSMFLQHPLRTMAVLFCKRLLLKYLKPYLMSLHHSADGPSLFLPKNTNKQALQDSECKFPFHHILQLANGIRKLFNEIFQ